MAKILLPQLEKDILKTGLDLLRLLGVEAYRRNTGALRASYKGKPRYIKFAESGQADVWGILPDGRHIEIEFKRPGQRPDLNQILWLLRCNERCPAFWVDNLDDLKYGVAQIILGHKVLYLATTRKYGLVEGPSGDYRIVPQANLEKQC